VPFLTGLDPNVSWRTVFMSGWPNEPKVECGIQKGLTGDLIPQGCEHGSLNI
jgi:hypothetical protein